MMLKTYDEFCKNIKEQNEKEKIRILNAPLIERRRKIGKIQRKIKRKNLI